MFSLSNFLRAVPALLLVCKFPLAQAVIKTEPFPILRCLPHPTAIVLNKICSPHFAAQLWFFWTQLRTLLRIPKSTGTGWARWSLYHSNECGPFPTCYRSSLTSGLNSAPFRYLLRSIVPPLPDSHHPVLPSAPTSQGLPSYHWLLHSALKG